MNNFQRKLTTGDTVLDQRYANQSIHVCMAGNVRQLVTMTTPAHARKDEEVLTANVSIYPGANEYRLNGLFTQHLA